MSIPSLNNGLFVRDTNYEVSSHVDSYHLLQLAGKQKPDDMGVIDIWANVQKAEMPLYQMSSFGGKNTIYVDNPNGDFTYRVPVANELPYIVENIETAPVLGRDGQAFRIKLNERAFGHGEMITYDKYNGLEMKVTDDDILNLDGAWIYTVELINKDTVAGLDATKYLQPGVEFFSIGTARGEYGERFNDITTKTGYREFSNFVTNAYAHVHYSVSSKAELIAKGGMTVDDKIPVQEIWRYFGGQQDPSVASLTDLAQKLGKEGLSKAMKNNQLQKSFLTQMEAAHLRKLALDVENYMMWGKGGYMKQDGPDDIRLSPGLWKQLDSSFKKIYNQGNFSLDMFRSELMNYYSGKVEFKGPDSKRQLVIQTGMAGMRMVNKAIKDEVAGTNLTLNASDIGAVKGKNAMELAFGFEFTEYHIPFLANVKFVLNPALDNVNQNSIENPSIGGYPLSSYSFLVFDITESGNDNIFMLKKKHDHKLQWWYNNGTMDYMGREQGFQSSSQFNGYKVFMQMAYPSIWVKDPTRVLKIVMKNPVTGGSL